MIISENFNIAFVHIPKCAGTTLRFQLRRIDTTGNFFWQRKAAPDGTLLDHHHLTLAQLADHYPESFAKLQKAESFALIRNPAERFASATMQYMRSVRGLSLDRLTLDGIGQEMRALARRFNAHGPPVDDPRMVHFTPQTAFVFHQGQQVVKHLHPVERIDDLCGALVARTGVALSAERHANMSFLPRSRLAEQMLAIWPRPISYLLDHGGSGGVRGAMKSWMLRSFVMQPKEVLPPELIALADDIADNHYAGDRALHLAVLERGAPQVVDIPTITGRRTPELSLDP